MIETKEKTSCELMSSVMGKEQEGKKCCAYHFQAVRDEAHDSDAEADDGGGPPDPALEHASPNRYWKYDYCSQDCKACAATPKQSERAKKREQNEGLIEQRQAHGSERGRKPQDDSHGAVKCAQALP